MLKRTGDRKERKGKVVKERRTLKKALRKPPEQEGLKVLGN